VSKHNWIYFLAALVVLFVAFIVDGMNITAPRTPVTTTVPALDCVAVAIDVQTGIQTETPAPCYTGESGCVGSITVTVREDGTVVTSCPKGGE